MITQEKLNKFTELNQECNSIEEEITDHMHKVIEAIVKYYGGKLNYWYFDGAAEGEMGNLNLNYMNIWIDADDVDEEPLYKGDNPINNFPFEFLLMTVENVMELIDEDYKERKSEEEAKKQKKLEAKKKAKLEKEKLLENVKKKLTLKEQKALGMK